MNELSNKMQTPYGDNIGQEAQQPSPASTANQQVTPEGTVPAGTTASRRVDIRNIRHLVAINNMDTSRIHQGSSSTGTNNSNSNSIHLNTQVMLAHTRPHHWA